MKTLVTIYSRCLERLLDRAAGWFACDSLLHVSWIEETLDGARWALTHRRWDKAGRS